MEKNARHPLLFALCGFVLCFMFASNLAKAQEANTVTLDMREIREYEMNGFILVYRNPLDKRSISSLRVFQGEQGSLSVLPGELIAVDLVQIGSIWRCKNISGEHRLLIGQGELVDDVRVTPRLVVENERGICRLSFSEL